MKLVAGEIPIHAGTPVDLWLRPQDFLAGKAASLRVVATGIVHGQSGSIIFFFTLSVCSVM